MPKSKQAPFVHGLQEDTVHGLKELVEEKLAEGLDPWEIYFDQVASGETPETEKPLRMVFLFGLLIGDKYKPL